MGDAPVETTPARNVGGHLLSSSSRVKPRVNSVFPSDRASSIGAATRSETIRNEDGEATVPIVTPQLLTTVARGRATVPMIHTYFRFFHEFLDAATHKVDVFHDWYEMTEIRVGGTCHLPPLGARAARAARSAHPQRHGLGRILP